MIEENKTRSLIDTLLQDRDIRGNSHKWANWESVLSVVTCLYCVSQHGKTVDISVLGDKSEVQAHPNCKCVYVPMRTKKAGTVTDQGLLGADMYLILHGNLPENYVTKDQAINSGWKSKNSNLDENLPGKIIGGNIYKNKANKLPNAPGRTWYEADINYTEGYRNRQRLLYSNDGLMFVTYDHYHTFYEITK